MSTNPFEPPHQLPVAGRQHPKFVWLLFAGISGMIGAGILIAESTCLLWMCVDDEFRQTMLKPSDAYSGLAIYAVMGLLFTASAIYARKGRRRTSLALFFLPIAIFAIALQVSTN